MSLPVAGVWSREWEEDPLGSTSPDRETLVLWTQSSESGVYVDLRLPADSPGRSLEAARRRAGIAHPRPGAIAAAGFHESTKKALRGKKELVDAILRQKSFAGVLEYSPGDTTSSGEALKADKELSALAAAEQGPGAIPLCTCFWRRDLDYQPPSGGLDVGVCASESSLREDGTMFLRETGDDGTYAEGWIRLAGTEQGPFVAMELVQEGDHAAAKDSTTRKGYWVRAGNRFAYSIGRPTSPESTIAAKCAKGSDSIRDCVGKTLSEAISHLAVETEKKDNMLAEDRVLDLAGSFVTVTGEIDSEGRWMILHSTNPELVGCVLVGNPDKDDLCCSTLSGVSEVGGTVEQLVVGDEHGLSGTTRRWKVLELSGCTLPLMVY